MSSKRITCEISDARAWGAGSGPPRRFEHLATGHWSPVGSSILPRDVSPRWMSKKCARDERNCSSRASRFWRTNDTRYSVNRSAQTLHIVCGVSAPPRLGMARAGWRAVPPPTVPRPRPTRVECSRRVDHASEQHRRPQECRARGGTEMNNNLPEQTCGNAEKTGQGP